MSECMLLLALLGTGLAAPLQAQGTDLATLERRVERLRARRAVVAAAVARRDSILFAAQRPQAIGTGPLFLEVPDWAAPILEPDVVRVVEEATRKYGPVFAREPAETLAVRYAPLEPLGPGRYVTVAQRDTSDAREAYLAARRFDVEWMALDRVGRLLGPELLAAIGGRYHGGSFAGSRRRTVVLLSTDPSGAGDRCLNGSVDGCVLALATPSGSMGATLRRSLLLWVNDGAGVEGWSRLAESDARGFEARLSVMAGRSYPELVAEWGTAVRGGEELRPVEAGQTIVALGWGICFVALFGWRLKWHHV
ncbi:MAG: hypothetical protein M3N43_10155 [Actinomycetota bacterium]|nr:hypothetical protein [Actinomycetota bacterium]